MLDHEIPLPKLIYLAPAFGDWRQSEKFSEIKPPLTFEEVKTLYLILKLLVLYIDHLQSVRNTSNIVFKVGRRGV